MNILHITATYPPSSNGVAHSVYRLVSRLRFLGHTVMIIGPNHPNINPDPYYIPLPTSHHLPFMPKDYPLMWPALTKKQEYTLASRPLDIIHVHNPSWYGSFAVSLGKRLRVPVVFTYHTQYDRYIPLIFPWLPKVIHRYIYAIHVMKFSQAVNRIIAPSSWIARSIQKKIKHVPVSVISSAGIDLPESLPQSKRAIRKKLNLPLNGPIFLTVSRLSKEKNLPFLISSFTSWRKRNAKGLLVVIGDGDQRRALENLVHCIHADPFVRFIGHIANTSIGTWYEAGDMFLFASKTETAGLTLLESFAHGLPVVALDHPSVYDVITHGINGILSRPRRRDYGDAIDRALKERTQLSKGAYEKASTLTLDRTADQILMAYELTIKHFK